MPSSISDHDLPYVVLQLKKECQRATYMTARCFKGYRADRFYKDMLNVPCSLLDIFDDAEDKLFAFNSLFYDILDEHAPIKTMKLCGHPNPYVTNEIRELMRTRDQWKKQPRKTKIPTHGGNVRTAVYCVQCTCTMYSVLCTKCSVYSVPCTVYSVLVQCSVYSVPCTVHVYHVQCTGTV